MANTITVSVVADVAKMKKGIDTVSNDLGRLGTASSKASSFLGKSMKVLGGVGAAAGLGIGALAKGFVDAGREGIALNAQTQQVIKTMGNAANISADGVTKLTEAMAKKTGVDDAIIQNGANMILTFGNIRNEVGKGNDIFNQTVGLANDMSVALGQDMKSSSIQLGKALNDPIKGVGALSRVGVSFTAQQKEQIKTLVESGNVLGAQKVILGEVGKQFGGAAAAIATPWDKLKVTLGILQGEIGEKFIPILDRLATYVGEQMPVWIEQAKAAWASLQPALQQIADIFMNNVLPVLKSVGGFVVEHAGTILKLVAAFYAIVTVVALVNTAYTAYKTIMTVVKAVTTAFKSAQLALNIVMAANPIGLVVVAIAALIAILVIAWKNSETFRNIVTKAWDAVKAATEKVWNFIKDLLGTVWEWIKKAGTLYFEAYKKVITTIWDAIKKVTETVWNGIKKFLEVLWEAVKKVVTTYFEVYKKIITTVWDAIKKVTETVWNALKSFLSAAWEWIKTKVTNAFNFYKTLITNVWNAIKNVTSSVWNFIKDHVWSKLEAIWNKVSDAIGKAKEFISNAWEAVKSKTVAMWNGIKQVVIDKIAEFMEKIRGVKTEVLDAFKSAGDWLKNVGENLIKGLIGGIKNMAKDAVDAAKGVVSGAINAAKNLLGINSPSRVFRQFGEYTVQGLVVGMKRSQGLAARASSDLARKVSDGFEAPRLSLNARPALAGSGRFGGGNTYEITVQAPVGASSADIGRELVKHIDNYERLGGRRSA